MDDFKKKEVTDLEKLLKQKREELRVFRFGVSGGKTKDIKIAVRVKKEIARILTEINLRGLKE